MLCDGTSAQDCCSIVAGGLAILESWEEPAKPSASQSVRGGDISASHNREGSGTTILPRYQAHITPTPKTCLTRAK